MIYYHAAFHEPIEPADKVFVELLDFPGVASQGDDIAEAREMITHALALMAEHYIESGQTLPPPNASPGDTAAHLVESVELGSGLAGSA